MWNSVRYTQFSDIPIKLGEHIFRPKKITYFLFSLLFLLQTVFTFFIFQTVGSWFFLAASIIFLALFIKALSNLLPECHSIALDFYGVYITTFFKTAYFSWEEILEINHVKSNRNSYVALRIKGHPEYYNFFKQGDFAISNSMDTKANVIESLMRQYKNNNEKLELEKYNPEVHRNFLFVSKNAWGREKVKELEINRELTIWQRLKRYRNRKY